MGSACQAPAVGPPTKSVGILALAPGPAGGRVKLFAATSLPELQAMVWGSGSTPSYADCIADQSGLPACWWKAAAPPDSLFVAAALNTSACSAPAKVRAELTGASTLQITADHGKTCLPLASSNAGLLTLLAIPLADLPPLTMDVTLVHPGAPAAGGRTVVDLRRPVDSGGDPQALSQEVRNAYVSAAGDAGRRFNTGFVPAGFAFRHWGDTSLECPVKGEKYAQRTVHGYVVQMTAATDPRHLSVEYHGDSDGLRFCSSSRGGSPTPSESPG